MSKSVSNIIMRDILYELKTNGINTKPIIDYCDISDYEVERVHGRIPEYKHYRFMLKTKDLLDFENEKIFNDCIRYLFHNHPEFIGVCLNENTAGEALDAYIKYRAIIGNCDEMIKINGLDKTIITYINQGPPQLGSSQAIFNFMTLYKIVNNYVAHINVTIGFTGKAKSKSYILNELFDSQCLWEQNSNYIIFNNSELNSKSDGFNKSLNNLQKDSLASICYKLENESNFSSLIKDMITHSIHSEKFDGDDSTLENICNTLNISRWTLNRKLQNENISFAALLKEVKIKTACELLIKSERSMQEISESIGFSSQSVFSRFFKEHFDMNPSHFRKTHKTTV